MAVEIGRLSNDADAVCRVDDVVGADGGICVDDVDRIDNVRADNVDRADDVRDDDADIGRDKKSSDEHADNSSDKSSNRHHENWFVKILRTIHMVFFVTAIILMTPLYFVMITAVVLFSRRFARMIGRTWNQLVLVFGGVRVKIIGAEKIDRRERCVYMSNHQSALDIPIIYAGINENVSFIAKKELFQIPVFGWCMSAIGHVSIDRGNARKAHASMIRAVDKLRRRNVSLVLFPEGTRSKTGEVLEFKTASFALARLAGVKLVPVAIRGAIDRLPPKTKRIISGAVELVFGDPIDAAVIAGMSKADLCAKVYEEIKSMARAEG